MLVLFWLTQAECLVETQANVYERFRSGMMAKEKKQEEKPEHLDENDEDSSGENSISSITVQQRFCNLVCLSVCLFVSWITVR